MNLFVGANASGKSSLLEALTLLSRGRSFRTARIQELIRDGETQVTVSGKIRQNDGKSYPIGISKSPEQTRIRINHADSYQQAELSTHLPVTLIHPDILNILTGPPQLRRSMLDWIAFYLYPDFHQDWKAYQRVLKQRNVCLRDPNQQHVLPYWTQQLIGLLPRIHQFREHALTELLNAFELLAPQLIPDLPLHFRLTSGLPNPVDLNSRDALQQFYASKQEQEALQRTTLYGAHRSDLQVLLNDLPIARQASRGQLKIASVTLLLAQSMAITNPDEKRGIIAIDDLASELDKHNQSLLYQVLAQTQQQVFITTTHLNDNQVLPQDCQLFHVEQGQFSAESSHRQE